MRYRILITILHWLAIAVILRVLVVILTNDPDYFPPDFDALFLQGREATFNGSYRVAFYVHILAGPIVLLNTLILLSQSIRIRRGGLHRTLGWVQVIVLLVFLLPTSIVMSRYAFAGWPAGMSFLLLSILTAFCAMAGVNAARCRRYVQHRRWMLRTTILIYSAVTLRLISGAAGLIGASNPEEANIAAAWSSWLVPLVAFEIVERMRASGR